MKANLLNRILSTGMLKLSIGQVMLFVVWLGLTLGLLRFTLTSPPREYGGCSEIAVSESGKYVAAAYEQGIHLYRNGRYINRLHVGRIDSLRFVDDQTLAIVSLGGGLPPGVHFCSLEQGKITRWFPLRTSWHTRVRLLDDKFIVQQLDSQLDGQLHLYDINASAESKPIRSSPSPRTNMSFDATGDGRHVAFYLSSGLVDGFDMWDSGGSTVDYDLTTGGSNHSLQMSNGLAFSPDGSFVITCRKEITKLNWPSAEKQWSIASDELCGRVRISRAGDRFSVVTGSNYQAERYLRVFDSNSARQLTEIKLSSNYGWGHAMSANGQSVWTAPQDNLGGLNQWDIASNSIVRQIGVSRRSRTVAYYTVLFCLWAALYGRLLLGPLHFRMNKRMRSMLVALSTLWVAVSCYIASEPSSLGVMILGVVSIAVSTWLMPCYFRRSLPGGTDLASPQEGAADELGSAWKAGRETNPAGPLDD